jgi:hypothetical protein
MVHHVQHLTHWEQYAMYKFSYLLVQTYYRHSFLSKGSTAINSTLFSKNRMTCTASLCTEKSYQCIEFVSPRNSIVHHVPHFSLQGMVHNVEYFPLLGIVQYALYSIPLYCYCLIYTAFFCARNNTICTAFRSIKNSAPRTVFRQFTTTLLLGTVRTIHHSSLLGTRCNAQDPFLLRKVHHLHHLHLVV